MDQAFDLQAKVGLTKHLGVQKATDELVERLGIRKNSYILDVGCGTGITSCNLAKTIGCTVVGVDIRPEMIERCKEGANRMNVQDKVEFKIGDAYKLPFKTNTFDAVMSESVLAVLSNRKRALKEYLRVAKKGGTIGTNEVIWIKKPTPELIKKADDLIGKNIPTANEWISLFKSAGVKHVAAKTYTLNMMEETFGRFKQYGWAQMLRYMSTSIKLMFTDPLYLKVAKGALGMPWELVGYWGYILVIGRK